MSGVDDVEWPPGVTAETTEQRLSEVYNLVRNYLDGESDDLRAYESLDFLYALARDALGLPAWHLPGDD
jgi:hypothetical protein